MPRLLRKALVPGLAVAALAAAGGALALGALAGARLEGWLRETSFALRDGGRSGAPRAVVSASGLLQGAAGVGLLALGLGLAAAVASLRARRRPAPEPGPPAPAPASDLRPGPTRPPSDGPGSNDPVL